MFVSHPLGHFFSFFFLSLAIVALNQSTFSGAIAVILASHCNYYMEISLSLRAKSYRQVGVRDSILTRLVFRLSYRGLPEQSAIDEFGVLFLFLLIVTFSCSYLLFPFGFTCIYP